MGQHYTDFREYVRGSRPKDWSARLATGPQLSVVEGMPFDAASRNYLVLAAAAPISTTDRYVLCWDVLDGDTGRGTQEVLCHFQYHAGSFSSVCLRLSGASTAAVNAYLIQWASAGSTSLRINKRVAGVSTTLVTTVARAPIEGAWYWMRAQATGTTIRARLWEDGDVWPTSAGPEPTTWSITTTDASLSDGSVGIYLLVTGGSPPPSPRFSFFSVGTNGDSALGPDSLPRTSDEYLRDPEVQLDAYLELDSIRRSDGVHVSWYMSKLGRVTGPTDMPANAEAPPHLDEGTVPSFSLVEGELFNDSPDPKASMKFTLDNERGAYDLMKNYIFSGCRAVLRVGEQANPFRRFEPVWAGLMDGEPEVTPKKVTIDAKLGAPIKDVIVNRTFVGIPTGVEWITNTNLSRAYDAVYDVTSFTICGRWKAVATTGAGYGVFCQQETSSTARHFRVYQYHNDVATVALRGRIGADLSAGGVAQPFLEPTTNYGISDRDFSDGRWHWWSLSVTSGGRSFVQVDGEVILELAATGVVDLPAATIYMASNFIGQTHCDYRFYPVALTEDEISTVMAARAEVDERVGSMWRCDDNSGGTVTDYGPNAKHLTLSGTINVNYRWQATDLGVADMAGQPVPISVGKVFNAECVYQDPIRNRFMCHDGLGGSRYTKENLKAMGTVLVQTTDYTDVGPGAGEVFDMVTAQSTPVTVDLTPETSPQQYYDLPGIAASLIVRQGWGADKVGLGPEATESSNIFASLAGLAPWAGGWTWADPPKVGDALKTLLGGIASLGVDRSGRLFPVALLPPVLPSPYAPAGVDAYRYACLEFMTDARGGVYADTDCGTAASNNDFTVAFWVKFHATGNRIEDGTDTTATPYSLSPIAYCAEISTGVPTDGWFVGMNRDSLVVHIPALTPATFTVTPGRFKPDTWYYLGLNIGNRYSGVVELYAGLSQGAAMDLIFSTATTGTYTAGTGPLVLGGGVGRGFWGSISHFSRFTTSKVDTDLVADLTTPPDGTAADLFCLFPLDDGEGDVAREVVNVGGSGAQLFEGVIRGCRWAPKLTFDLRKQSFPEIEAVKALRPAWRVEMKYRKNHRQLTGAGEIAGGVAQADRPALLGPGLSAPAVTDRRKKYPDSRPIIIDSALALEGEAKRAAQMLLSRFSTERQIVSLSGVRRESLLLQVTDEIALIDGRFFDDEWANVRIVVLKGQSLTKLAATIDCWG